MPFRSEAQRRLFAAKVASGEITQAQYDEWESASPKKLPEKVGPRSRAKPSNKIGTIQVIGKKRK
jgi:hypothetical protein